MNLPSKGTLIKLFSDVATDTIVLFDLGDLAVSVASAEILGIAFNAASTGIAIGNRVYSSLTGKPKELGFYAAAAVSAGTSASIVYNGITKIGLSALMSFNKAARIEFLWPAAAFAFWTVANALGGWKKTHKDATTGVVDNPQTYFSLGSASVAKGNPFAVTCFMAALLKSLRKEKGDKEKTESWSAFFNKHVTPKRLRAMGYLTGALSTAYTVASCASPQKALWYVAAYALLTAGNYFYDKEKNKTFRPDLRGLLHKPA